MVDIPEFKGKVLATLKHKDGTLHQYEVTGTIEFTHNGKVVAIRYDDRPKGLIPIEANHEL